MAEKTFVAQPSLSLFRANKSKNGHASRFQLSRKPDGKVQLFLEIAKQVGELDANGNANYAWANGKNSAKGSSVTIKLGNADVGEMLAVLRGNKKAAGPEGGKFSGLFHKNANGSSTLKFNLMESDGKASGYSMAATSKKEASELVNCSHSVSFGEAETLRVFLERCLVEMNRWFLTDDMVSSAPVRKEQPVKKEPEPTASEDYTDPYDTVSDGEGESIPF